MTELRTELHDEEQLSTQDMATAGNGQRREQPLRRDDGAPQAAPAGPNPAPTSPAAQEERAAPLFAPEAAQELRSNWDSIQTGFVDNPRQAVEQADHLVAQTIKRLAEVFANERNQLEQQWSRGDNVSTEDLRVALQRYRSFFDRLLSF
jgi:hypothetical protein